MTENLDIRFIDPWKKMTVLGIAPSFKDNMGEMEGWKTKNVGRAYINGHLYLISVEKKGLIVYDGETRLPFWTLPSNQVLYVAKVSLPEKMKNPNEQHVLFKKLFNELWKTMTKRGLTQDKIDLQLQQMLNSVEKKYGKRPKD